MAETNETPAELLPEAEQPSNAYTNDNPTGDGTVMIEGALAQQYQPPEIVAVQLNEEGMPIITEDGMITVSMTGGSTPVIAPLDNSTSLVLAAAGQPMQLVDQGTGIEETATVISLSQEMTDAEALPETVMVHPVADGTFQVISGEFPQAEVDRQDKQLTDEVSATDGVLADASSQEKDEVLVCMVEDPGMKGQEPQSSLTVDPPQNTDDSDNYIETEVQELQGLISKDDLTSSAPDVSSQESDAIAAAGSKPTKDVIFVCIHGQSFRCRPQTGIPVDDDDAPVPEEPPDSCACSKPKKHTHTGVVKGFKLARKLRNRKPVFTCNECGGRFGQKSALDVHMAAHKDEGEEGSKKEEEAKSDNVQKPNGERKKLRGRPPKRGYTNTCSQCGKTFSNPTAFAAHKRMHRRQKATQQKPSEKEDEDLKKDSKTKNLSCTVCEKTFTRMYDVERHMETHIDSDRKKCGACGKQFNTIKTRERHERLHCEMKKENMCSTCGLVLPSKFKLLRHEREHLTSEELDSLSCKNCGKVFTNPRSLLRHEKLHLKEEGTSINCTECPAIFTDMFSYNIHKKMHAIKPYQCDLCGMRFKHEYLLNVHTKRMTCQKTRESLRDVECDICNKIVKGTATMKRHMRTHTKEKPYPCRLGCDASFSSTSNRLSHERMYCKLSPSYLCTHCGEVLSNQARLIYHESKYHGIGPLVHGQRSASTEFPCRHCGKVFFFKGGRKRHERIHTNEKPYMCQYCPKAFVHASALVCHERTHTKERPYICDNCGKCFSQATHLKTHIRVHTKEKPYQCRYCDKAFSHMGTRKSHEATHKISESAMQAAVMPPEQVFQDQPQAQLVTEFQISQQMPQERVIIQPDLKVMQSDSEPVQHRIHIGHHEHEVQAADVILQLLESGSRVQNFEGIVHMTQS